ncbi:oligosaccharide flippase family protein [Flavobacterium sp. LB3P45]|uniref:Oligosaccharide flippase family protein n=1 Tax=Flavobacterium fructosi TaxID=3230416 RepID=A0ABW6HM04_9FLAO
MKKNLYDFKNSLNGTKTKQIIALYLVNIIGIPLGIVTSMILTNYLGPKLFGDYSYLNGIFTFAMVIFNFGFLYAANRALVLNDDREKAKEIYGSSFILLLLVFLLMSVCLIIFGYFDSNINNKGLYEVFLYLMPFGWIYLLTNYFETLFQADNRIKALVFIRFYPKIGFFLSSLLIYFVFRKLDISKLLVVYVFYILTFLVVYAVALWEIKLSFKNLKPNFKSLWQYTKNYGFDVYIGSLFAVGVANLATLIISNYDPLNSNEGVGFFNLALTFTAPLALIPNIVATTHYKEFAGLDKIPSKLFKTTILLTLGSLVVLWVFIGPFIDMFYGKQYHSAIELTLIISLGIAAHGMADFFNRYLGAHGKGKMLRNSSVVVGISLLITNFLFIPIWHEKGAVFARLISGMVYLLNMLFYYKKYTNSKK